MSESRMIYYRNCDEIDIMEYLGKLENCNSKLYHYILTNLRKNEFIGIREDLLSYLADNGAAYNSTDNFIYNFTEIVCNPKVTIEHLKWIKTYFLEENRTSFSPEDFILVLNLAVEKEMPLKRIKELLMDEDADIQQLCLNIAEYSVSSEETEQESVLSSNSPQGVLIEKLEDENDHNAKKQGNC